MGVTVVAFRQVADNCFAYGQGAAVDYFGACERAVMELARNEYVLGMKRVSEGLAVKDQPSDLFERRCVFFASKEGHELFQERIRRKITGPAFTSKVVCDTEIEGPWSEFAVVWRSLIKVPFTGFLADTERYFFW
jgi:hypothetical protein